MRDGLPQDSFGDLLSLRLRWLETHAHREEPCVLCAEAGRSPHMIAVCVHCEWPPALDGKCRCDWEDE